MATGTSAGLLNEQKTQSLFKHQLLTHYVPLFTAMTGSTSPGRRVVVLDGYAGRGRFDNGSPASAELFLQTAHKSSCITVEPILVERAADDFAVLQAVAREYADKGVKVSALNGQVETHLPTVLQRAHGVPLFLFLDPTGAGLPFQRLAGVLSGSRRGSRPQTEVLLNFNADLTRRTAGQLIRSWGRKTNFPVMDAVCGGDWWKDLAIDTWRQYPWSYERVAQAIVEEYASRLSQLTNMKSVWIPVHRGLGQQPVYHLVFLTHSAYGVWVMADAIAKARTAWLEALGRAGDGGGLLSYDSMIRFQIAQDQTRAQAAVEGNLRRILARQQGLELVKDPWSVFGAVYGVATEATVGKAVQRLAEAGELRSHLTRSGRFRNTVIRRPQL